MKLAKIALLVAFASALIGCGPDLSMDFILLSKPEGATDIDVSFEQVRLEEGFTVAVQARPLDNSKKMDWETQVELFEAGFDDVMSIQRMEFDEDREEDRDSDLREGDWNFLFSANRTGSATMEVWIDGEFELDIPVFVNPQP